ncbi:protein kinase, partial [Nocardia seriolae]|nr:protein kinase [Nocardia seriolae]MTJ87313.1 protein kinase [Nocardia seriolae]MTK31307.1 protein kinase [Nocardia seriolae]MTK47881.1 protein kinase [Nocardia seriolae]MTL12895.1 protein kinase [Nocardia seriolae]
HTTDLPAPTHIGVVAVLRGGPGIPVLQAGDVFAGYAIERVLGSGGMGAVYLARHPRMNRHVALKVLNEGFAADPKVRMAFDREAALAVELDHPNIIPVYDRSGPDDPALWLAMRHIDGGDATTLLATAVGGLPAEQAIRLITDAAHALDYAHGRGVLHRDVKPANLLIEQDLRVGERALLTDFGIARTLNDTTTHSGVVATLAYTAPERFTDRLPTDHRADIYSLGCTFYQLLTGEPPFPRNDQAAVIAAHLGHPAPLTSSRRPDLPRGLDAVITTSLAKDPANRYQTCADLAEAAQRALGIRVATSAMRRAAAEPDDPPQHGLPPLLTTAPPRPPVSPATKPAVAKPVPGGRRISRRQLLIGGAIAVPVTAAAAGVALAVTQLGSGSGSKNSGAPSAVSLDGVLTGHIEAVKSVAFSPDGSLLASGSLDRTAQLWDVHSRKPDGPALEAGHAVHALAFSPDGSLLATAGGAKGDWATQLWDVRARQPDGESLDPGSCTGIGATAFSPDGTLLAVGRSVSGGSGAQLWNVRTRQLDSRQIDSGGQTAALAFSPDGSLLATSQGSGTDTRVRLWNTASRQSVPGDLVSHVDQVVSIAFSPDGTLLATGSRDTSIGLWDARSHLHIAQLVGHVGAVLSIAFSPDGTLLTSGGADRTVRLWNVHSRSQIGTPNAGHTDQISSVRFSPDGTLIATASLDRTIRLWRVNPPH